MDNLPSEEVRDAHTIALRALALFGVVGLALGAPRNDILDWLKAERLWDELSPTELAYVSAEKPTHKQKIYATWWSERLIVLLWALGKLEQLPAPNKQCDTSFFQDVLPPYVDIPVAEFVASSERRADNELISMADELMNLHWEARDAEIHSRSTQPAADIEIIQERHHAINWIIGYEHLSWDEVTTDT